MILVVGGSDELSDDDTYTAVVKDCYKNKDGDYVVELFTEGGDEAKYVVDDKNAVPEAGSLIAYTISSNGEIDIFNADAIDTATFNSDSLKTVAGYVYDIDGDFVTILLANSSTPTYKVADDAVVIDATDADEDTLTELAAGGPITIDSDDLELSAVSDLSDMDSYNSSVSDDTKFDIVKVLLVDNVVRAMIITHFAE